MLRMLQLRYLSLSRPGRLQESLGDHQRLLLAYRERSTEVAVAIKRRIVMKGLANIEKSEWVELNGSKDRSLDSNTSEAA